MATSKTDITTNCCQFKKCCLL